MSVPVITFFNNKGGVGKTTLVYHLAWMYTELGLRVLAADIDPQANLTSAFVNEDRLEELWPDDEHPHTIAGCLGPLIRGVGDVAAPHLEPAGDGLSAIVGDLALSGFEDELATQWPGCLDRKERAFRVISAFWRILQMGAKDASADVILMDLGPNLGAINRAALIASDFVAIPLSPDLFSLQGLRNLGPTLRRWREEWGERLARNPLVSLILPKGEMKPVGYIVLQHSVRLDRPVKAYNRWIGRIPDVYHRAVLDDQLNLGYSVQDDPSRLALLKHYRSLMPMAQEARKPMFDLKPADGAIGSHIKAVQGTREDFETLARELAVRTGLALP